MCMSRMLSYIPMPNWCGIGAVENRDFQKKYKIMVFKEDIDKNEIRNRRASQRGQEHTF